jgi:uncharacterized membrane protein
MAHERIEIDLPLAKVYELLSNPVDFPKFMSELELVTRLSSQSFQYQATIAGETFQWTTNVIDDLRNTRFAWITINGNLNQTGTIRFTPLDNGTRTRIEYSLDYRTFFGQPSEELSKFIDGLSETLQANLQKFKDLAENDGFTVEKKAEAAI